MSQEMLENRQNDVSIEVNDPKKELHATNILTGNLKDKKVASNLSTRNIKIITILVLIIIGLSLVTKFIVYDKYVIKQNRRLLSSENFKKMVQDYGRSCYILGMEGRLSRYHAQLLLEKFNNQVENLKDCNTFDECKKEGKIIFIKLHEEHLDKATQQELEDIWK